MYTFYYTPDNRTKMVSILTKIGYINIRVKIQMDNSKQKLLLSLLVEFEKSFSKQINESVINQEIEQLVTDSVQELSNKQYRGSLFDKRVNELIKSVNHAKNDEHLIFNDYSRRLWEQISQISQRTTSFETAYSLIDILNSKNASLRL